MPKALTKNQYQLIKKEYQYTIDLSKSFKYEKPNEVFSQAEVMEICIGVNAPFLESLLKANQDPMFKYFFYFSLLKRLDFYEFLSLVNMQRQDD